jgi:hypothetical protein
MKKLLISLLTLASLAAVGQPATPIMRFIPLLSGYNVLISTNSTAIGLGSSNVLYTTYNGQVLFSLTNNNVNGTLNTNGVAPDAFKIISLASDANGDVNANAAVYAYACQTNWIPTVVTNSQGQEIVTNWVLAPSTYPNWQNPASTNAYPLGTLTGTNNIVVTLYRGVSLNPQGSIGPTIGNNTNVVLWETTSSFSFIITPTSATTPIGVITNLPISWLQGAKFVYATVSSSATNNTGAFLNQLGILQPQP